MLFYRFPRFQALTPDECACSVLPGGNTRKQFILCQHDFFTISCCYIPVIHHFIITICCYTLIHHRLFKRAIEGFSIRSANNTDNVCGQRNVRTGKSPYSGNLFHTLPVKAIEIIMIRYIGITASGTTVTQNATVQFLGVTTGNRGPSSIHSLTHRNRGTMNGLLDAHEVMASTRRTGKDYFCIHIAAL